MSAIRRIVGVQSQGEPTGQGEDGVMEALVVIWQSRHVFVEDWLRF
jgi:hypothetical protein